ncbi:MAG: hypothetical protein NZ455_15190 [Bacteroidia bacterium]|nr:hypothetical protein [Bacteroidia bacterium]MDW8301440.1 hypothetical protein [Bacteroidia bacterium]
MINRIFLFLFAAAVLTKNKHTNIKSYHFLTPSDTTIHYPQEKHLKNVRQLTFGGNNAEAYFSPNGKYLIFQSDYAKWGNQCDQIYLYNLFKIPDLNPKKISTGLGRTTCAYFMPDNRHVIYASTHAANKDCPPVPERKQGKYVWPIYPDYDIYLTDIKTGKTIPFITGIGYDAEATVSPDGKKIVFTSDRSGDLELYVCDIDGKNIKQITHELGYDGGAFFSPDSKKIVFRASRPKTEQEIKEYKELLAQHLVQPTQMEIFTCNVDGSDMQQITHLGKANWAPFYHPSGKKIIFSSNHASSKAFQFNLYMINTDGTGLEKITYDKVFDSFPMFSPDGKKLVFSSNRNNGGTHDTNLFIADWVD